MKKVIDWFKHFWFIWFFLLLFHVILRVSGYDFKIVGRDVERTEELNTLEQRRKLLSEHPELMQMGFTLDNLGDPAKFTEALSSIKKDNYRLINNEITDEEINNYIKNDLKGITPSKIKRNPTNKSVEIFVDGDPNPVAIVYKNATDGKITSDYSDWNTTKPNDFSISKYDVKREVKNGLIIRFYKLLPARGVSLSDYVGEYNVIKPLLTTAGVVLENNKLIFNYGSLVEAELTPSTENDKFTFDYLYSEHTVVFKRDSRSKVNGFAGVIFKKNVVGNKIGGTTTTTTQSKPSPAITPEIKSRTTPVIVKKYTKYDAITPEDRIKGFQWKDCENKDFPYEFGCKNTKIGQMNECLFGSTLNGIFSNDLLEKLKDMAFNMDKKQITKEMYDAVMLGCKQQ
jgi:hypothetical protein